VHAEINLAMIACFLTIIGYSVNDTIVIFDRIRENCCSDNARQGVTEPLRALINRALNQTLSRTLLTSLLTMFVVLAQFLVNWGSESDLESFAFAMIIGLLVGVYSTIYIAAPILIWMHKDEPLPGRRASSGGDRGAPRPRPWLPGRTGCRKARAQQSSALPPAHHSLPMQAPTRCPIPHRGWRRSTCAPRRCCAPRCW
jgi:hypothetical protein